VNYFAAFELAPTFLIDIIALASRFRELQSATHPDRFVSANDADKREAMARATEVNEAYQTLRDPVRRAMYMLWLKGINAMDEKNTSMPHAFLVEQIDWREAIADAKLKEDTDRLEEMGIELASVLQSLVFCRPRWRPFDGCYDARPKDAFHAKTHRGSRFGVRRIATITTWHFFKFPNPAKALNRTRDVSLLASI
jgi:molecular chaperone HscB